jgi:flagellin
MVVQHNMQAANANRMLNVTTSAQSKSTEKLSSGYRINRAADDAAGLTISEKMRKQIRGLDQASTNAQDGVSSVQTAEGALTEVHSMLQRMNELATQAANGTNSKDSDRQAIQDEIEQLTTEIDRVSETTKFNETYLLKGDAGTKAINLKAHDAGLKGTLTDNGDGTATFTMNELKAGDSVSIGGKTYKIGASSNELKNMLTKADIDTNHTAVTINGDTYKWMDAVTADTTSTNKKDGYAAGWYKDGKLPADTGAGIVQKATYTGAADIATKVKAGTVEVGTNKLTIIADDNDDGVDDNDVSVISKEKAYTLAAGELLKANQIGDTNNQAKVGIDDTYTAMTLNNATNSIKIHAGQAQVANSLAFSLHVGADADMTNKIQVNIDAMDSASLGIKGLNVKDDSGNAATYAVDAISDAISKVSSQRSSLGAVQNRLEHTINNLDNVVENTTTAESRIRDTDMAEEMVNYSKNNILAQAGQSMLAQANQSNQGVLSLLQ